LSIFIAIAIKMRGGEQVYYFLSLFHVPFLSVPHLLSEFLHSLLPRSLLLLVLLLLSSLVDSVLQVHLGLFHLVGSAEREGWEEVDQRDWRKVSIPLGKRPEDLESVEPLLAVLWASDERGGSFEESPAAVGLEVSLEVPQEVVLAVLATETDAALAVASRIEVVLVEPVVVAVVGAVGGEFVEDSGTVDSTERLTTVLSVRWTKAQ
jgi:hypothetical protein